MEKKIKFSAKMVLIPVLILAVIIVAANSFTVVDEGHIGIQYRFGQIVQSDMQAGLHMKIPFTDKIVMVDTREQMYTAVTPAYTKDTQTVEGIEYTVNYRYADPTSIIKTIGISNVESRIIIPRTNAVLKNLTGKYKAEDLVQGRSELQSQVMDELSESFAKDGIILTSFSIKTWILRTALSRL